jgi:hypothetical protein
MSLKNTNQAPTDSLCVQTIDLIALQNELEETTFFSDSDEDTLDALRCSQEQMHDVARIRAERILNKNPHNAAAIYVTGLEAESRQDWAEAGVPLTGAHAP